MKNVVSLMLMVLLVACGDVNSVPNGGELDNGNNTERPNQEGGEEGVAAEWCGVAISEKGAMQELVDFIGSGESIIDGDLFVEALTSSVFNCLDRYMLEKSESGELEWNWCFDWVGASVLNALCFDGAGEFCVPRNHALQTDPAAYEEVCDYMSTLGYDGWYTSHEWKYDPQTNLLTTICGNVEYVAKVLYFRDNVAILEGHIVGVAWLSGGKSVFEKELYKFEFASGREAFFDCLASAEEYFKLWDDHCQEEGLKNEFLLEYFLSVDL